MWRDGYQLSLRVFEFRVYCFIYHLIPDNRAGLRSAAYFARIHLNNELKLYAWKRSMQRIAQTKQQFFDNISHELRTPISLILPDPTNSEAGKPRR